MTPERTLSDGVVTLRPVSDDEREEFAVEVGGRADVTSREQRAGQTDGGRLRREQHHLLSPLPQGAGNVAADEAGRAGEQNGH